MRRRKVIKFSEFLGQTVQVREDRKCLEIKLFYIRTLREFGKVNNCSVHAMCNEIP